MKGGTLVYLEQQAHTNLYPPAGGFYPNGGILNQITDKLTYQNPEDARDRALDRGIVDGQCRCDGVHVQDPPGRDLLRRHAARCRCGGQELRHLRARQQGAEAAGLRGDQQLRPQRGHRSADGEVLLQEAVARLPAGHVGDRLRSRVARRPSHCPTRRSGDATKIIGSGPFVVASETLGRELTLKARKDYNWGPAKLAHQGRAYLDAIKYIVTPEDSVRIGALLAGQADVIRQIQAYDEKQVEDEGYRIYAPSTRGVNNSVVFRPDNPLVSDVRVRRALLHATNTDEIVSTLFSDNYPKATSIIAKTALGYVDLSPKLVLRPREGQGAARRGRLEARRERPAPEGRPDARARPPTNPCRSRRTRRRCSSVAQQWGKIGVKLNVLTGDSGSATVEQSRSRRRRRSRRRWSAAPIRT